MSTRTLLEFVLSNKKNERKKNDETKRSKH